MTEIWRTPDGKFPVDNSRLEDVAKCATKSVLSAGLGLRGKAAKDAADVGTCFHEALRRHFKGIQAATVVKVFSVVYLKMFTGREVEDDRLAKDNCEKILAKYVERHPLDSFPFTVEEAEEVRHTPLDDEGRFEFYGKLDLLGRNKQTGQLWPVDHKSRSSITAWWTKGFRLGSQMTGYVWLTSELTGEVVPGAIINAIEVKKLPASTRKCAKHGMPYAQCSVEHAYSELFMVQRTPELVTRWRLDAIGLAIRLETLLKTFATLEMVKYAPREGVYNDSCKFCEYGTFCGMGCEASAAGELLVLDVWAPWAEEA